MLLAGELVDNSVIHANGDASREIVVELVVGPDVIHVAVTDQARPRCRRSGRGAPASRPVAACCSSRHLSDRWGSRARHQPDPGLVEMVRARPGPT